MSFSIRFPGRRDCICPHPGGVFDQSGETEARMRPVSGPLLEAHWPLAICRVCSPIFAEYRMYLNGSVFWYFSMSLR